MSRGAPRDYDIGFGRPPVQTRFTKGRSGNPRGRPKRSHNMASVLRQVLNERVTVKENGERRRMTKLEAALKQLVNRAAAGDSRALRDLLRVDTALNPVPRGAAERPATLEELIAASFAPTNPARN
jgi:hypothetical protein